MTTYIVIGGQWGDEGKGKIVDYLTSKLNPKFGVRFNGGANAGHTIRNQLTKDCAKGEMVLHLVPSTVFSESTTSVIGNGVALDPEIFTTEVEQLEAIGISTKNILLSDKAHLVLPWHKLRDNFEERKRGRKIGTTGKGIGPVYADKAAREGIRLNDLRKFFQSKDLKRLWDQYWRNNALLGDFLEKEISLETLTEQLQEFFERFESQIAVTETVLQKASRENQTILLEGAQGTLLDLDFGSYPMVTSSGTTRLGVYQGSGLTPGKNEIVFGLFKGYATRVGEGPFPTELFDETGQKLQSLGMEVGATTGRKRRCGWFDSCLARYSNLVNGFDYLVLTKNDILDDFEVIKICVGYKFKGKIIDYPPTETDDLESCEPIYEEIEGWGLPTKKIKSFSCLPEKMRDYTKRIEELSGVAVGLISVGQEREETIQVNSF